MEQYVFHALQLNHFAFKVMGYSIGIISWLHWSNKRILSGTFNTVESESMKNGILIIWLIVHWLHWMQWNSSEIGLLWKAKEEGTVCFAYLEDTSLVLYYST